ncbi:MAG: hypothetical protein U0514_03145 [Candidatus Andersenbacteria bacterium]
MEHDELNRLSAEVQEHTSLVLRDYFKHHVTLQLQVKFKKDEINRYNVTGVRHVRTASTDDVAHFSGSVRLDGASEQLPTHHVIGEACIGRNDGAHRWRIHWIAFTMMGCEKQKRFIVDLTPPMPRTTAAAATNEPGR